MRNPTCQAVQGSTKSWPMFNQLPHLHMFVCVLFLRECPGQETRGRLRT